MPVICFICFCMHSYLWFSVILLSVLSFGVEYLCSVLLEFSFTIIHVPGVPNIVADALSHSPIGENLRSGEYFSEHCFDIMYLLKVTYENIIKTFLENIDQEQSKDPNLRNIIEKWQDCSNTAIRQLYLVCNGILYKRNNPNDSLWYVCVSESIIDNLIWYINYSYCHFGPKKCLNKLNMLLK